MKILDHALAITQDHLKKQMNELQDYCELDSNVYLFVKTLIFPLSMIGIEQKTEQEKEICQISYELYHFLYHLFEFDFTLLTNPYHFNTAWIYELNFIIGNMFNDDFIFSVTHMDHPTEFSKVKIAEDDDTFVSQDPLVLLQAAIKNVSLRSQCHMALRSSSDIHKQLSIQSVEDLRLFLSDQG